VSIEENCGPLAKFWLPAKFEDNPLSALKPFNPDRGTAAALALHLQGFLEVDARREATDVETSDCLKISDSMALQTWLIEADDLRFISASVCSNLARLRPLFRSADGGASQAMHVLDGLLQIKEIFSSLDGPSYKPNFSSKLVGLNGEELRSIAELADRVRSPGSGLRWMNPLHWMRKRRVQGFLSSLQLPQDIHGVSSLYYAAERDANWRNTL
jgi:hypothetical protein